MRTIKRILRSSIIFYLIGFCFLSVMFVRDALAGDDLPQWLRQAAATSLPSYGKEVPAVVLLNEQSVKVEEDGRVITLQRSAVRILTREGRSLARADLLY